MKNDFLICLGFVAVLAGCSADNDSTEPAVDTVAINFSGPQYNDMVTRATGLQEIHDNFGVYAFKNGNDEFMDNVKVSYDNGAWNYSPAAYWDYDSPSTSFIAYSPYSSDNTTKAKATRADVTSGLKISSGYDSSVEFLYGYQTVSRDDYGKQVAINFRHANAQVVVEFYTDITDYDVSLTGDVTATPATPSEAYISGYETVSLSSDGDGLTVSYNGPERSSKSLSFASTGLDVISTSAEAPTLSPTVYYAAPQAEVFDAEKANVSFRVQVPLKLTSKSDKNISKEYTASAEIPAYTGSGSEAVNLTQWLSGRRYVYRFCISRNSMRLILLEVYKPNPSTGAYELASSSHISIAQEDPSEPADARRRF